ncbi:MAG: hypothetical protein LUH04_11995 [Clostridium sp.]|nr:hypothetical protein [Clostridium sp.]
MISNGIHAIWEKQAICPEHTGEIYVDIIRQGREETLFSLKNIDSYPIHSFKVTDNGIGLNDDNMKSFSEFNSDKKAEIGGKGVGRLVCLKAFNKLVYESVYCENREYSIRTFEYKKTKEGFEHYTEEVLDTEAPTGTSVILYNYEEVYQKNIPFDMVEIARQIILHFQLYYVQGIQPTIIVRNQNRLEVNLTDLYRREFQKEILQKTFSLGNHEFTVFISRSYQAKSHKIHYCAHQRTVKEEGTASYLEDLRLRIEDKDNKEGYYFQIFVVGEYLDKNVNESRTNFEFENEDMDFFESEGITLARIRKQVLQCIEELLSDFFKQARTQKLEEYYSIVEREFPNYHSVIHYNKEKVEKLPVGLTESELDLKLYEIENEWRLEVKKEGKEILDKKKDITSMREYKEMYEKYLTQFNDIGQADLARYVIHRRSVIHLLERLIEINDDDKFSDEDLIHSLFFPIRETKDTVLTDKQNLWLLDERLTFNSLLASDKRCRQVEKLESDTLNRIDLLVRQQDVFEQATLFSEDRYPFESFTIVEFKKPNRDDYSHGDEKRDPVKQVRKYIKDILAGKIKKNGRPIQASENIPFYCYIVADITHTLEEIIKEEGFTIMPDGQGYFKFYDKSSYAYMAYIEIVPFMKVIKNAKERNKVLFDKLKLS